VDYTTALESALVPEKDYNRRRISHRASALIQPLGLGDADDVARFMRKVYDIRSQVVHGSRLSDEDMDWLSEHSGNIELRVRQVLAAAVRELPPGEKERRVALASLHDPTDDDRGSFAFEKFKEIKTPEVRKTIAAKIASMEGK
jgi:hypothetical protein